MRQLVQAESGKAKQLKDLCVNTVYHLYHLLCFVIHSPMKLKIYTFKNIYYNL